MRGDLVERGGRAEDLVGVVPGGGDHLVDDGVPPGERPGLVEEEGLGPAELLERGPALDDHPAPGCPREAGHDGDGRGEDQGARRGDHEHGHGAAQLAGRGPGDRGEPEAHRQEGHGPAVGQAHERRGRGRGLTDQPHDAGIGRIGGVGGGPQVEGPARVDHAAADQVTGRPGDRDGLTGQRALVEHGGGGVHQPVDRHDLAREHEQQVPDRHGIERDVVGTVGPVPVGDLRGSLDERGELPLGPASRPRLQGPAGGQHHRHHRPGERLADHDRADEGHERQHVDAETAPEGRGHHPAPRRDDAQHRRRGPHPVRGGVVAEEPGDGTCGEAGDRDHQQHHVAVPGEADHGTRCGAHAGGPPERACGSSRTVARSPPRGDTSSVRSPPLARASWREMASPSPVVPVGWVSSCQKRVNAT